MGKSFHDDVLDGALNILKNNVTRMTVCHTEPTTYTEAITTYELADVTIDSSDFTNADGDSSGRKTTVGSQAAVVIDNSGTATHIALVDVSNTKLLAVTTCNSQGLTLGNAVTFPAFDFEFTDPT